MSTCSHSPDAPRGMVETRFDPIHSAARARDVAVVRRELQGGVHVDHLNGRAANGDGGNTALWFSAQGPLPGGAEVARILLAAGADINRPCEHGRTALHMAAAWGHLEVVQLFLDSGADPTLEDDDGHTPGSLAAESERVPRARLQEVMELLSSFVEVAGRDAPESS